MSVFGVDYAWGRPGATALKAAKVTFAARYLSHDTSGKNLTHAEAKQLSDAGIACVVVWESTASRALSGHAGGVADATEAAKQAKACGMPSSRPIYFAVDFDASAGQEAAITSYLGGVASVIGLGRTGVYGGYDVVKHAMDGKHATWGWQTYAWSGGKWSKAQLQQYSNDHLINGIGLDYDRGVVADFGQWKVGGSTTPTPTPPPAHNPTLRLGDYGPAVVHLQQRLNAHGSHLKTDGYLGALTEKAVRAFQHAQHLTVDGIVGPKTWANLG